MIVVLLMYLYVMNDVLFERLFFGRLGPQYSLCAYLKMCVNRQQETRIFIWRLVIGDLVMLVFSSMFYIKKHYFKVISSS